MAYGSQEFIEWHREGLSAVPSETKPDDSGEQTETQVMGGVVSARGESDSLEVGKGDAARADNIDNSGKESGLKHEPFEEHVATTNAYVIGTRNDRPDTPRAIADADACTSGVPVVVHAENGEVVAEKEANHGEPTQETTRVD